MKIQVSFGTNGYKEYTDMYLAYLRVRDLRSQGISVSHCVFGNSLERNAWKEMFINDIDDDNPRKSAALD